jgi:hypothetical protein
MNLPEGFADFLDWAKRQKYVARKHLARLDGETQVRYETGA